jgi:hypothetical protein
VDHAQYVGTYKRATFLTEVFERDGELILRSTMNAGQAHLEPEPTLEYVLAPLAPDRFVMREPGTKTWEPVTFGATPDSTRYVHYQMRANPMVSTA